VKLNYHAYQMEAVKWLVSRPHAGLFLDMGLGKTVIALTAIDILRKKGLLKKTLVIAPLRVCYTGWPGEVWKWDDFDHLSVVNWHKHPGAEPGDITVINPEGVKKMIAAGKLRLFDHLIIDESSMWKAHDSQRFRSLKNELHRIGRRWILTGTPAPNSLMDLWAQMFIVDLGKSLGGYITHFRNAFCRPSAYNKFQYELLPGAAEEIYDRVKPLVLRMAAKDYLDMPKLVYNAVVVELPPAVRVLYDRFERDFFAVIKEHPIESPTAAVLGMRLRQLANGGIYNQDGDPLHVHDAKVGALKELAEVIDKPLLVFYEFKHDVARIRAALGAHIPNLSGDKNPEQLIADFAAGKIKMLLAHSQSGGYGLNLQDNCADVVWFGLPWSRGNYDQANARVWRQGQQSERVTIHHIVAKDTMDQRVESVLRHKGKTQADLLHAVTEKKGL